MAGNVIVKSRTLACSNSKWNVHFTHVVEGTREVPDYLVIEPKVRLADDITGVLVIPVLDGQIGLLRMHRVAIDRVMLEGPRGFVDEGETAADAALRELEEETGLVCATADVIALGTVVPESSTMSARMKLYAALNCQAGGTAKDDELGLSGIEFFSLDQIRALVEDSSIEDSGTLAALFRLILQSESQAWVRDALGVKR